jgi:general secretion pathway protein K
MTTNRRRGNSRRGSALLTVLWISAALAAVSLSLATTVRGETERVSTDLDGLRAYYLAVGAVERAMIETLWGNWHPESRRIPAGPGWFEYNFPTGTARVEMIPESAKLDVNNINPGRLSRLLAVMEVEPDRAQAIVNGIVNHRRSASPGVSFSTSPSFPGPPASFQEIEEVLSVPGVTPEIFYGTYVPVLERIQEGQPRLVRRSGLVDCLSVYGSSERVDANTADPAVLAAVGVVPAGIQVLLEARRRGQIDIQKLGQMMPYLGPGAGFLRVDANSIYTIRATASVRLPNGQLSDVRRTVAKQVKYMPSGFLTWIDVLRWYDTAWSN